MTQHMGDLLSAYLDGELADSQLVSVQSHVADCDRCADELRRIGEARDAVRALPVLEAPTPLLPRIRRGPRWVKAAASAAAGLLVVGITLGPGQQEAVDLETLAGQHTSRVVVGPSLSPLTAPGGGP